MIYITGRCAKGHVQELRVSDELGEEYARTQAGLLDGSSPHYLYPPGPESAIGKCGVCGSQITCIVSKQPLPVEEPVPDSWLQRALDFVLVVPLAIGEWIFARFRGPR